MNQNNQIKINTVAFLSMYETAGKDGYLGALLITDSYGVPQEFRCTHPVKPTTIQKPLYGDTLVPHIGVNLCGLPLIKLINAKPSIIMVDKNYLLDIRPKCAYPIVFVRRAGEAIDVRSSDEASGKNLGPTRERVDCPNKKFQPIVIEPHPDFDEDRSVMKVVLDEIFKQMDPIEPFQRIAKALNILGKQDTRFQ